MQVDDVVREFLVESFENLQVIERGLLALEARPDDPELLAQVFRGLHTLKGTSGFLALATLENLAHAGENLLASLREGRAQYGPKTADALLEVVDAVREHLRRIESSGSEAGAEYGALIARLAELATAPPEDPDAAMGGATTVAEGTAEDATVRVEVGVLDTLMNLVGELVLARNRLLEVSSAVDMSSASPHLTAAQRRQLHATAQAMHRATSGLQEQVTRTRLQPVSSAWAKLPRVARDAASATGRQVRLHLAGGETELDRGVLETIRDPLVHIVRNAVAHGIEPPSARVSVGKQPNGNVDVRAFHEGSSVVVEVADDGAGVDVAAVAAKAVETGLVSQAWVQAATQAELVNLVFAPGLSTMGDVTHLAGRGVGMDVVRSNIQAIGGSIEVETTAGAGTTVRIIIPLTVAIVSTLVVRCAGQRYAVPQAVLREVVRLEAGRAFVESVGQAAVLRVRSDAIPAVRLRQVMGTPPAAHECDYALIVRVAGRDLAVLVDEVDEVREVVVKPLAAHVAAPALFTGAAVLGDGAVCLILDPSAVAAAAHAVPEHPAPGLAPATAPVLPTPTSAAVLCESADGRRVALPLRWVRRLEDVAPERLEVAGERVVVQQDGVLLPLVAVEQLLPRAGDLALPPLRSALRTVVVCEVAEAEPLGPQAPTALVGIAVSAVLDVLPAVLDGRGRPLDRSGDVAVIGGRVTHVLDAAVVAGAVGEGRP